MKFLFLPLLFVCQSLFAQNLELDVHHKKVGDYMRIEKSWGHVKQEDRSNYVSGNGIAQPLIYRTKQKDLPDLFSYYFFYSADSSMYYILYEWDDVNIHGYDAPAKKTEAEIIPYKDKYRELLTYITKLYGEPQKTTGSLYIDDDADGSVSRKDNWQPNDSTTIQLYCTLSGKSTSNGMVSVTPTYRIRLYVNNTAKLATKTPVIDKKTVAKLDSTFQLFYAELKNKNYEAAKAHLSAKIIANVGADKLEKMAQNLRLDTDIKIYFTGMNLSADGSQYLMLHYKYIDEKSSIPEFLIKVMFDDKNKIVGIQPTKKM